MDQLASSSGMKGELSNIKAQLDEMKKVKFE